MMCLGAPKNRGFSLVDLLVAIVILALLAAVAIPSYRQFVVRAKNARAIGEIGSISIEIDRFRLKNNGQLPTGLAALPMEIPLDPWGMPYQYLKIEGLGAGVGGLRKDSFMNPLNSDYDLYSSGDDKESRDPLSNALSRDDIVRANNGAYIGLGEDY